MATSSDWVLVTGAASGVGRAVSKRLRESGWLVAAFDIAESDGLDRSFRGDVRDETDIAAAIAELERTGNPLSGVVHCAGVFQTDTGPVHTLSMDVWAQTISINLTGSFVVARQALPRLVRGGGSLVFISSVLGQLPQTGSAAYCASKAGVSALSRSIAIEYAPFNIRSNVICPGWIDTPMAGRVLGDRERRQRIEKDIPVGRVAMPKEVADVAEFLVSDRSSQVTADEIYIDGGTRATPYANSEQVARMWKRVQERASAYVPGS